MTGWNRGGGSAIAGLILMASACAHRTVARQAALETPTHTPVHVFVDNKYGFPMTIYAVGSGTSFRIGKVLPGFVSELVVPRALVGKGLVEFVAINEGDVPARSGALHLSPGQIVDFTISRPAYTSSAIIRQ